jgi:hypothetical protein
MHTHTHTHTHTHIYSLSLSLSLPLSFEVKNMTVDSLNLMYMGLLKKNGFDLSYILFLPPSKYGH